MIQRILACIILSLVLVVSAVFVALLIWGAYYLVTYWTPPPAPVANWKPAMIEWGTGQRTANYNMVAALDARLKPLGERLAGFWWVALGLLAAALAVLFYRRSRGESGGAPVAGHGVVEREGRQLVVNEARPKTERRPGGFDRRSNQGGGGGFERRRPAAVDIGDGQEDLQRLVLHRLAAKSKQSLDDIVGFIGEEDYREFAQPYLKELFTGLGVSVRFFHNDSPCQASAPHLSGTGINLYNMGIDVTLKELQAWTDGKVVLMGNIPPRDVLAAGTPVEVERAVEEQFRFLPDTRRILFSCGGGMPPNAPTENIRAFNAKVQALSRA